MKTSDHKAAVSNPALKSFEMLIGKWRSVGSHPMMEGVTLHGSASFEWIEGGAFILMRSSNDEGKIPTGTSIFGSDNTRKELFMLYFDDRPVSRKCDVSFEGKVLKWWRTGPEFSQRYLFTVSDDGNTIISKGEMSKDGKKWERDLDQTFTRI